MSENLILDSELTTFSKTFDTTREDKAAIVRGEFLQKFPLENISKLTLEKYVIGRGTSSFCAYVEAKTKSWANVQGATSAKFGIYFGKIKGDSGQPLAAVCYNHSRFYEQILHHQCF